MKEKFRSKTGISVKMCEVMQYIEYLSEETILKVIEEKNFAKWCYILHDKDCNDDGTLKAPHWHIFLHFGDNSNYTGAIASWFGIEPQFVNKIKATRYTGAIPYCIHKNDTTKYQYDPLEVKANFDYIKVLEELDKKQSYAERQNQIISGIMDGTIRKYNFHDKITPYEYHIYKKVIDDTFDYRMSKIARENRDKEVIYICGDSGAGKTSYAKKFASDKGLSCFVAGADNDPLDDYGGEDVLVLDELRGSSQRVGNLLKMLDNNTNSKVKSRYKNKVLECQFIIITSVENIETFFNNVEMDNHETIIQLKRRAKTYIQMDREEIFVSFYDEKARDYLIVGQFENPIKEEHPVEELTEEKIEDRLKFLFNNSLKKNSPYISKYRS